MGASTLLAAALINPSAFDALILCEPILFPPLAIDRPTASLALGASKRRANYPSLAAAAESYRTKSMFAAWDDRVFDAYMDAAFADVDPELPQGEQEITLRCTPSAEAATFRGYVYAHLWEALETGAPSLPPSIHLITGSSSHVYAPHRDNDASAATALVASRISATSSSIVPGSHFLCMEHPSSFASLLLPHLDHHHLSSRL